MERASRLPGSPFAFRDEEMMDQEMMDGGMKFEG
jgi:hypothetical protein